MSTTSISRNNKNENNKNNLKAYNYMNNINRNNLKNKILNNDLENLIFKSSGGNMNKTFFDMQNKYVDHINNINNINNMNINNINISNKTYKDDYINYNNYLDISSINHRNNYNQNKKKIEGNSRNVNDNLIFAKKQNSAMNKKPRLNRNISARTINRNKSKIFFNNSTIEQSIINSGIMRNMKQQEMKEYKNKKEKYLNQSTKMSKSKKILNNFYNYNDNSINYNKINKNYLPNRRNTNISIPKNKKDFLRKEFLKSQNLYYPVYDSKNNVNMNHKKSSSVLMSSTVYSKKKNNPRRLTASNSMNNINENDYLLRDGINRTKSIINDNLNSNKNSKSIISFPFLNLSLNKKMNIDNTERNDINFKFNKHKNNMRNDSLEDKTRNGLNYDFLTERIKNKRLKNN